ncbi:MAG TPA: hypothetical protein VFQ67_08150 [Allosphingosinicella sp.]|nr:hypothetical protein [Allosphingosinicella sp.]
MTVIILVVTTATETGKGLAATFALIAVGVLAAAAALLASDAAPGLDRHWTAWLKPRPTAILFLALFAALGTMTDALSLLEPRPAVESSPGKIEDEVGKILARIPSSPGEVPRVSRRLPGRWGEIGCRVVYRFRINEKALLVDLVRRPPDVRYWQLVATITHEEGDVMEVRAEEPEAARGDAATFTYVTNGVTEHLIWDDQGGSVPLKLDRCGGRGRT